MLAHFTWYYNSLQSHLSLFSPVAMARKKGVDLFCASQASTAICMSMEQRSIVQPGSRAIDRHNPHLREVRRSRSYSQSSSQPSTKISTTHQKSRKSTSSKPNSNTLLSPSGSSRYLLTNTPFFDVFDSFSALVPTEKMEKAKPSSINSAESTLFKPSSRTKPNSQVVVLRVSLHCKGCEGKVRKHISRMEGVTSFSIDFAMKKVTIVGDVTPLSVLASVSRVKNAQLWPTTTSSSVPSVSVGSDKLISCQKS